MDMLELMVWLAERGVTAVFKADGDRMVERRKAWTVVVGGGRSPDRQDAQPMGAMRPR
ncbi:hypothetical protein L0F81_36250 [Streptomyces tricolor]|uniref:Uncharacterized protein n=1 Tax=Streptomyces tricolor TaxID=68277 RepID=A0ABS9JSX0_9ACTN|nr:MULTISPECIES: hypothetical protein [Streptomyces]MCG0068659.1 hypothetical protein [Streptomyces tricolor]